MADLATQQAWEEYLSTTPSYGSYYDRCPEYHVVFRQLARLGLAENDLIVDVGAGWCDFDHYIRTEQGWRGRYMPIDGSIQGIDMNLWSGPRVHADWYVCIETLEHLYEPGHLVEQMKKYTKQGMVVTTPNADVVDVLAVDRTHVIALDRAWLQDYGFKVHAVNFSGRGDAEGPDADTLVGVWTP